MLLAINANHIWAKRSPVLLPVWMDGIIQRMNNDMGATYNSRRLLVNEPLWMQGHVQRLPKSKELWCGDAFVPQTATFLIIYNWLFVIFINKAVSVKNIAYSIFDIYFKEFSNLKIC